MHPKRIRSPFPRIFDLAPLAAVPLLALVITGCGSESAGGDTGDLNGPPAGTNAGNNGGNGNFGQQPNPSPDPWADPGNTNVSFGGSQDFGYFRQLLDSGVVPRVGEFDAPGFFAEHHTPLPAPSCGERVCVQAMLGVLRNLLDGVNCTMLQIGLNSPIAANPDSRPPLTLAVVVDVSGSMRSENKLAFVRQGLDKMIDSLRDGDRVVVITYADDARTVFELQDVSTRRHELRDVVDDLVASGGTNLFAGLEAGYEALLAEYDSGRQQRVILLSDGEPTEGVTNSDEILQMSRGFNSEGIGLTTVGLGRSFNYTLMQGLAQQGDGNFYFLEDAGAVDEVFDEEMSFFTVPVVFDLELSLAEGSHYEFGRAVGAPLWEDTANGGKLEVPSVFLAHRESHDDVTDDGGRRGGGSALLVELMPKLLEDDGSGIESAEVATIHVRFREPGTDRIVEDTVVVRYPHAPWITLSTGFFDETDTAIVQKSFVMLNIYVALEMASDLFYRRELSDAIAVLENLIAAVEDYNEEIQDTDMDFDLLLLGQLRDVIFDNMPQDPPPPRNDWDPEDPWPCD